MKVLLSPDRHLFALLLKIFIFLTFILSSTSKSSERVLRSIGNISACSEEATYIMNLPQDFGTEYISSSGKYHLLLTVTDAQLWGFLNWMSIAIILQYIPSSYIQIHIFCPPPFNLKTLDFFENYLKIKCIVKTKSESAVDQNNTKSKKGISFLRQRMKFRLQLLCEIAQSLVNTNDMGVMSFDLDAPWLRNMVTVFDHFKQFDFISQSTANRGFMQKSQIHAVKRLFVNFGGVLIRNNEIGHKIADATLERLQLDIWNRFPDQDTLSEILIDGPKTTQRPFLQLETHYNSTLIKKQLSIRNRNRLYTGVYGNFTLGNKSGKYLLLPVAYAMRDCHMICSSKTILFQHCGIGYCVRGQDIDIPCEELPEFLLESNFIQYKHIQLTNIDQISDFIINFLKTSSSSYQAVTRDSESKLFIARILEFVDVTRISKFCEAYSAICSYPIENTVNRNPFHVVVHNKIR